MLVQHNQGLLPLMNLHNFIDNALGLRYTSAPSPQVNILEREEEFELQLAVPGMNKEHFHVDVQHGELTITGEQHTEEEVTNEKDNHYVRREFGHYSFSKSFSLPEHVDAENITAQYVDGVLRIHLPKIEEDANRGKRAIEIQ